MEKPTSRYGRQLLQIYSITVDDNQQEVVIHLGAFGGELSGVHNNKKQVMKHYNGHYTWTESLFQKYVQQAI
jgi:hypothetical protein